MRARNMEPCSILNKDAIVKLLLINEKVCEAFLKAQVLSPNSQCAPSSLNSKWVSPF